MTRKIGKAAYHMRGKNHLKGTITGTNRGQEIWSRKKSSYLAGLSMKGQCGD